VGEGWGEGGLDLDIIFLIVFDFVGRDAPGAPAFY